MLQRLGTTWATTTAPWLQKKETPAVKAFRNEIAGRNGGGSSHSNAVTPEERRDPSNIEIPDDDELDAFMAEVQASGCDGHVLPLDADLALQRAVLKRFVAGRANKRAGGDADGEASRDDKKQKV